LLCRKKYKGFFGKIADFDKLIDLSDNPVVGGDYPIRKRSFTLPEGSEL
jgi:hypothetical protein